MKTPSTTRYSSAKFILILIISLFSLEATFAKGGHMDMSVRIKTISLVRDSIEITFSGTMTHVGGDGPSGGDHWGFSARVEEKKLIIADASKVYFFTTDEAGRMFTHNFKDQYEYGKKIYETGRLISMSAYDPIIYFNDGISKIAAASLTLSTIDDTMSHTKSIPAKHEAAVNSDKPSN